ncbi:MAG: Holliday junction branch migration DNA helicase RuvB [Bdellovibrionaceae bacterium]|nr:Holliday junction branch migration DNA helicase RuvB [Pseudobdellovibrionaceae bacterium]
MQKKTETTETTETVTDGSLLLKKSLDKSLRPLSFQEFPGQKAVKKKLEVFVQAAKSRKQTLDHVLLSGPPGLGKTTLAHIIANALGSRLVSTSGPALSKKGDLAGILTNLKKGDTLFIDEVHRLSKDVEEYLYSAMEDFFIEIFTGEGLSTKSVQFPLAPFTLIVATTRVGLLKAPFRNRFGIIERLVFYEKEELMQILERSAQLLNIYLNKEGALEIASRSRGTPRIANRLLRRVCDYAEVKQIKQIDKKLANFALNELGIDTLGLDFMDRKILLWIRDKFKGGPVGIESLAAVLNEEVDTLEEVYEPFLIQEGFLQKTARGRVLTEKAALHLK